MPNLYAKLYANFIYKNYMQKLRVILIVHINKLYLNMQIDHMYEMVQAH